MMTKLMSFLIANPVDNLTDEVIISDRFKDEKGEVLKFKIKALTADEFDSLQKTCTKIGKKGKVDFNQKRFNENLIINYTLEPNFKDAESIKQAGCVTSEQLLNKVLLAGEVSELTSKISQLSGFDNDMEELQEEAKN
ncbi:MAG: phage tail assembly chaperone [Clostridium sp.]